MVHNKNRCLPHLAATFGSLSNAFYMADSLVREGKIENTKYVDQSRENGLENVVMLHEDTPPAVIRWVINFFNEWFDGAEASFLDRLKECMDVQEEWRQHKQSNRITVKTCGGPAKYESVYKTWLAEKHDSTFPKWQWYDNSKCLVNLLTEYEAFEPFKQFCEEYVDFLEPSMTPWTVISICKDLASVLVDKYGKILDKQLMKALLLEALKFCVPLQLTDGGANTEELFNEADTAATSHLKWIFAKPGQDIQSKISWMQTDMRKSSAVKKAIQEIAKYEQKVKKEQDTPEPASAKTGDEENESKDSKAKRPRTSTAPARAPEKIELEVVVGKEIRARSFIDDVASFMSHEKGTAGIEESHLEKVYALVFRMSLAFLWTGEVTNNVRTFTKWSDLRKELKSIVSRTFETLAATSSKKPMDSAALGLYLLQLASDPVGEAAPEPNVDYSAEEFRKLAGPIASFFTKNPMSMPIKFHNIVTHVVTAAWSTLAGCPTVTLGMILNEIGTRLLDEFPCHWVDTVVSLCDTTEHFTSFPQHVQAVFKDGDSITKFLTLRPKYVIEMSFNLAELVVSAFPKKVIDEPLQTFAESIRDDKFLEFLRSEEVHRAVAPIDCKANNLYAFTPLWRSLLVALPSASPSLPASKKVNVAVALAAFAKKPLVLPLEGTAEESGPMGSMESQSQSTAMVPASVGSSVVSGLNSMFSLLCYNESQDTKEDGLHFEISAPFVDMIKCYLDHKVKTITFDMFRRHRADWDSIGVDAGDKDHVMKLIKPVGLSCNFRMIFGGAVSALRSDKACYLLGSVFGYPFYIVGTNSFASQGCGVAWSVRKHKKGQTPSMNHVSIPFDVCFDKDGLVLDGDDIREDRIAHKFHLELLALEPAPGIPIDGATLYRNHIEALDGDVATKGRKRLSASSTGSKGTMSSLPEATSVHDCVGMSAAFKALAAAKSDGDSVLSVSTSATSKQGSVLKDGPKHILK